MREDEIVAKLRTILSPKIGDDGAVIGDQVVTTDMLVEGVDFTADLPLRFVARKSLAVNLSDIAAMGARPAYAVAAVGVRREDQARLEPFFRALREAADEYGVEIVVGHDRPYACLAKLSQGIAAMTNALAKQQRIQDLVAKLTFKGERQIFQIQLSKSWNGEPYFLRGEPDLHGVHERNDEVSSGSQDRMRLPKSFHNEFHVGRNYNTRFYERDDDPHNGQNR